MSRISDLERRGEKYYAGKKASLEQIKEDQKIYDRVWNRRYSKGIRGLTEEVISLGQNIFGVKSINQRLEAKIDDLNEKINGEKEAFETNENNFCIDALSVLKSSLPPASKAFAYLNSTLAPIASADEALREIEEDTKYAKGKLEDVLEENANNYGSHASWPPGHRVDNEPSNIQRTRLVKRLGYIKKELNEFGEKSAYYENISIGIIDPVIGDKLDAAGLAKQAEEFADNMQHHRKWCLEIADELEAMDVAVTSEHSRFSKAFERSYNSWMNHVSHELANNEEGPALLSIIRKIPKETLFKTAVTKAFAEGQPKSENDSIAAAANTQSPPKGKTGFNNDSAVTKAQKLFIAIIGLGAARGVWGYIQQRCLSSSSQTESYVSSSTSESSSSSSSGSSSTIAVSSSSSSSSSTSTTITSSSSTSNNNSNTTIINNNNINTNNNGVHHSLHVANVEHVAGANMLPDLHSLGHALTPILHSLSAAENLAFYVALSPNLLLASAREARILKDMWTLHKAGLEIEKTLNGKAVPDQPMFGIGLPAQTAVPKKSMLPQASDSKHGDYSAFPKRGLGGIANSLRSRIASSSARPKIGL